MQTTYEYITVVLSTRHQSMYWAEEDETKAGAWVELNVLGQRGWELVSVVSHNGGLIGYLKRTVVQLEIDNLTMTGESNYDYVAQLREAMSPVTPGEISWQPLVVDRADNEL